jgi:hypothetical protein
VLMGCVVDDEDLCPDIEVEDAKGVVKSSKSNNGTTVLIYCNDKDDRIAGFYQSTSTGCPAGKHLEDIEAHIASTCI